MEGEFPFVAKIIYSGSQVGCTGSLIAPDKVLTAAHCVIGYSDLSVGFGNTRTLEPSYPITSVIPHPDVDSGYQANDIAILQLESPITTIQPIPILTLDEELRYAPSGSRGVSVGWGSTHRSGGGDLPGTLQKITDIPIYTEAACKQILDDLRRQGKQPQPPSIHEKVLCAGEENRAIGQGDSGGPLLVQTPKGWAQIGVLSQATRDPSPQTVTYMGQWTRTSYFLDWTYAAAPVAPAQWLEEDNGQYTIYYVSKYEQDVEFVRMWLNHAEGLMLEKYGLSEHGYDISVYLPPAPTRHAGPGLATIITNPSTNIGEIHYMTPSAPAYGNGALGSLQLPAEDYHAKTLVHEYVTVGQERLTLNKTGGFYYYSAPPWFVEGLEEHDGQFHSTESNRTRGYERLLDYADRRLQETFYAFGSTSAYFGGMLLMKFMAEQYGEDIHVDLLTSEQPTFDLALDEQLARHGRTASEAFEDFQRWFQTKLSRGIGTVPAANPFDLYFAHSAAGGGWRTDLVLLNTNPEMVEATVKVFGQDGGPRTEEQFSLLELSVAEWTLTEGEEVETGGVVVSSPEKLSGFLRFRHEGGAATSVQSAPVGSAFMVPVSSEADQTGLAVYNADDKNLTVVLRMGERAFYKTIPAQGKIAGFVDEYFPGLDEPTGALIVRTDPSGGQITVLALEIINGNLVTLPAAPLDRVN